MCCLLSIEWYLIKLHGPSHGIVTKTTLNSAMVTIYLNTTGVLVYKTVFSHFQSVLYSHGAIEDTV